MVDNFTEDVEAMAPNALREMQWSSGLTIGMDISDRHCHLAVPDDGGAVVQRDRLRTASSQPRST